MATSSYLLGLLSHEELQALRAGQLLEQASLTVKDASSGESLEEKATRLRGAAVIALSAAQALSVAVGWLEAFSAVDQHNS